MHRWNALARAGGVRQSGVDLVDEAADGRAVGAVLPASSPERGQGLAELVEHEAELGDENKAVAAEFLRELRGVRAPGRRCGVTCLRSVTSGSSRRPICAAVNRGTGATLAQHFGRRIGMEIADRLRLTGGISWD